MTSVASLVNIRVWCGTSEHQCAFCSTSCSPFPSLPSLRLTGGVVTELTRGVRLYFYKFVHGLSALSVAKAQLGLGHSYSRAKVKFNVHRSDNMIIQSIALLDQLDKDINTFAMRIRCVYIMFCAIYGFVHSIECAVQSKDSLVETYLMMLQHPQM